MNKYTKQDLISYAKENNIKINSRMTKAALEDTIKPFLLNQLNNKKEVSMQYVANTPSSMMSVRCAMDMRLPTDDMHTVITTTVQGSIDTSTLPTYLFKHQLLKGTSNSHTYTTTPNNKLILDSLIKVDRDEAQAEADVWARTFRAEYIMDEMEKPSPSKAAINVFIDLISRKHQLYHTLDTMTIMDPKDVKHPQYAVRDEKGDIMQYNRNTAWAEALRQWDWNLDMHRTRTLRVLGINMARDTQGKLTSMTRGITTYPPTYTFTTTKGKVLKVVEGEWIDDTKAVSKGIARVHGVKQVKVMVTENKRNDKAYQDAFYHTMVKRIRTLKAMMGTKRWDAEQRKMISNQDGIEVKGHKAGYDYGKAARITRAMTEAQAPMREEIKMINSRLDKATEIFGHKIWDHYFDCMKVDLNLNFISGCVAGTCDDLNAHDASLNRGDDLSKAHLEEAEGIGGTWYNASDEDRKQEGENKSKNRAPFDLWRESTKEEVEDSYWVGTEIGNLSYRRLCDDAMDTNVDHMGYAEEMEQFFMSCEENELSEEEVAALILS